MPLKLTRLTQAACLQVHVLFSPLSHKILQCGDSVFRLICLPSAPTLHCSVLHEGGDNACMLIAEQVLNEGPGTRKDLSAGFTSSWPLLPVRAGTSVLAGTSQEEGVKDQAYVQASIGLFLRLGALLWIGCCGKGNNSMIGHHLNKLHLQGRQARARLIW